MLWRSSFTLCKSLNASRPGMYCLWADWVGLLIMVPDRLEKMSK